MYIFGGKLEGKGEKKILVCMDAYTHARTHTPARTHLYSHVIRHLAYGFNSC